MAGKGTLTVRIVGDTEPLKGSLKDADKSLGDFAKAAATSVAAAGAIAGAALVGGLINAMEKERLNDKLKAQLGLTEQTAQRAGQVAGEVYAGAWGESLEHVNSAIRSVGTHLVDLNDTGSEELTGLTTAALDVASAFDQDVNEVVRAAGNLLKNDLVDDATAAFDVITAGFQNGADGSEDFLDSINEYSEPLASLGLSGEDAVNMIISAMDDGIWQVDKLFDAFKEFSIKVLEPSKDVTGTLKGLGLDVDELQANIAEGGEIAKTAMSEVVTALLSLEDPLAREMAGVALFGTMWEDVGGDVILNALKPIEEGIGDVTGATQRMSADLNENAATAWESFKRRAGVAITAFAEENVLPAVSRILAAFDKDGLGGALEQAATEWESFIDSGGFEVALDKMFEVGMAAGAALIEGIVRTILSEKGVRAIGSALDSAIRGIPILGTVVGAVSDTGAAIGDALGIQEQQPLPPVTVPTAVNDTRGVTTPARQDDKLAGVLYDTPAVPAFAHGGIVKRPMMGLVGEAGPEAIIPLSKAGGMLGGDQTIVVQIDGQEIARALVNRNRRNLSIAGNI